MKDERGEQLVCTRGLLAFRHNTDALATSPSMLAWLQEQYYGKWPFTRVLGMQELFSVLFSFGNMIPFVYYRNAWRKRASPKFYLVPLFKIYCLVGINTWLWSAAFHARDTWVSGHMQAQQPLQASATSQPADTLHTVSRPTRPVD